MSNAALVSTRAPTYLPRRKVAAGGLAGAISAIVLYIIDYNQPVGAKELAPELAAAITTLITFVVSWLIPPSDDETTTANPKVLPAGQQA